MRNIVYQIRKDAEEAKARELSLAITQARGSSVYLGILLKVNAYRNGASFEQQDDDPLGIWIANQVLAAGSEAVKQAEDRLLAVARGEA